MLDLPSPEDVFLGALRWLGVPLILILPLSLALWVADWWAAGQRLGTGVRRLSEAGAALSRQRPVRLLCFALVQSLLAALVYSGFRLAHAMSVPDAAGTTIADGRTFTWVELWAAVTTYSSSASLPLQAFLGTVGWLLALNLAHVARSRLLVRVLTCPMYPVMALCALAGLGIGAVGLIVLSLATWMHSPHYNVGMVTLYAAWVIILWGGAVVLPTCVSQAEEVYGQDPPSEKPGGAG